MGSGLALNGRNEHRTVEVIPRWMAIGAQLVSDAALVVFGFWLAYWLRYTVHVGGDVSPASQQPFSFFYGKITLLALLVVAIFQLRGFYRMPRWSTLLDEVSLIANTVTTSMALVILYSFLQRFYPSRLVFILAWLVIIGLLICKRLLVRFVRERLWLRGVSVDRVLIVGAGRAGQRMLQWLYGQPQLGYHVVGFVDDDEPNECLVIATQRRVERPTYLGPSAGLREIVRKYDVDEVIIALPPTAHEQMMWTVNQCRAAEIEFKLVPDLFELTLDSVNIHEVAGLPLIGLKPARIAGWNFVVKRSMDIVLSLAVLVLGSIFMIPIAIAIKLDSDGPILFRQERVGRHGRRFVCFKFRTMVRDAESMREQIVKSGDVDPRLIKDPNDPRRTRVGRFLRKFSLDELPQFINVLLGEMSIVGPRPPVPAEVAEYDDWHRGRLLVTPGLTGLWQVSGRSNLTFDEMVRLDLYYAEHWAPWLDIKIILRTIPAIVTARGAY